MALAKRQTASLEDKLAKARESGAPGLRKQYIADSIKAAEDGSRVVEFTITTSNIDRDGDIVALEGWRLQNFMKNPVVLYGHNYWGLPVGQAQSLSITGTSLRAATLFAGLAEQNALAECVYRMILGKFLRATSVGFVPIKWAYDEERGGYDILEQELLEYSIVPVPANPECLSDIKAAGIALEPLIDLCEQTLAGVKGAGLWVPREDALAALKALKAPRVTVSYDPEEILAPFTKGLAKSGRVLSSANEERIRTARSSGDAICAALDEVLAQLEEDDADKGKKGAALEPAPVMVSEESLRGVFRSALEATGQRADPPPARPN
jgi:HK97 family phage prohead protease